MVIFVKLINENEELGTIELKEKIFKTGSKGYHGFGKIDINGKKHQINFMLIEIGTKKV
jgi:hypothetical protein